MGYKLVTGSQKRSLLTPMTLNLYTVLPSNWNSNELYASVFPRR